MIEVLKKGISFFKMYGTREFLKRLIEKREERNSVSYVDWKRKQYTKSAVRKAHRVMSSFIKDEELTIILYINDVSLLDELLNSIMEQTYTHFRVYLFFPSEIDYAIYESIFFDDRILFFSWESEKKVLRCIKEPACGDYLLIGKNISRFETFAFEKFVYESENKTKQKQSGYHIKPSQKDVLYSDSEMYREGEVLTPIFKPDYNKALLMSHNYIGNCVCVKKELIVDKPDIWGMLLRGSMWEIVLNLSRDKYDFFHVPTVLFRQKNEKQENNDCSWLKKYIGTDEIDRFLSEDGLYYYDIHYKLNDTPLVSIIIPNKDHIDVLQRCLDSIDKSNYKFLEVIIVENNSTESETFQFYNSIIQKKIPYSYSINIVFWKENSGFNYSALNNYGAQYSKGKYIILLNNDIEIITANWIEIMISELADPEVGIVGTKLFYPDDTIQHAGIVVGIGGRIRGVASNMLSGLRRDAYSYCERANTRMYYSAVTAACLMVSKDLFWEVGGLTEELAVAFNDVDFCLKVIEKGYKVLYCPSVEAYHHESKSRGSENTPEKLKRFQGEIQYMRNHWEAYFQNGDPNYNPNLSLIKNDYSIGMNRNELL